MIKMQIKINDQLLELNSMEVKLARKHFAAFLEKIHSISKESGRPSFYYTFLIISYVMSQDLLDMCESDMLEILFRASNKQIQ